MAEKTVDKKLAEIVAEFITSQKYEDLPPKITEHVKHYIIDLIGCTVGASV